MQEQEFAAPIAGQSLTDEPKGFAWERPPAKDTVAEALEYYLPKLAEDETLDDIHVALDSNFPLDVLVESIYVSGVMEGIHTLDVGLLVAPVIHEFILASAKSNGISVREEAVSNKQRKALKDNERMVNAIQLSLERGDMPTDTGTELVQAAMEFARKGKTPKEAVAETPEPPKGLMSKRGNEDGI